MQVSFCKVQNSVFRVMFCKTSDHLIIGVLYVQGYVGALLLCKNTCVPLVCICFVPVRSLRIQCYQLWFYQNNAH